MGKDFFTPQLNSVRETNLKQVQSVGFSVGMPQDKIIEIKGQIISELPDPSLYTYRGKHFLKFFSSAIKHALNFLKVRKFLSAKSSFYCRF